MNKGYFSKNLLSLKLQLETVLAEAGGEGATELLDGLSLLTDAERTMLLRGFNHVVQDVITGNRIIPVESGSNALERFEEELYTELLDVMREAGGRKLAVVKGGKRSANSS